MKALPQKRVTTSVIGKILMLIFGVGVAIVGIKKLIDVKKQHNNIDSVADARVTKVIHLGKNNAGKNQYAITYKIILENPFEVLVTPSTLEVDIGSVAAYYYERIDPKGNYFIVHKWKFDPRFKMPILISCIGCFIAVGSIISFF